MGTVNKRKARDAKGKRTKEDYKDAKGKPRYDAQVYIGRHPTTGRPQFLMQSFVSEKLAEAWVREQDTNKDQNLRPTKACRETLADYLKRWLPVYSQSVRDVTAYNISTSLYRWVIDPVDRDVPMLGNVRLDKLTADHFEALYLALRERHEMKPRGIKHLHGALKQALKAAVTKRVLPRNPIEGVALPKENAKGEVDAETEVRYLTREQAMLFLDEARKDRQSALWHTLLCTGIRPCEAFALKWDNIDLDKGALHVRGSLTRISLDKAKWKHDWKITLPKTKAARRTIKLVPVAVAELRKWQTAQKRERLAAGETWVEHDFVFTTKVGTPIDGSNLAGRAFARVMKAAGLGRYVGPEPKKPKHGPAAERKFVPSHRLYDLRHTYATLLIEAGETLQVVSVNLGHTNLSFTARIYAHVTQKRRDESAVLLARALGG